MCVYIIYIYICIYVCIYIYIYILAFPHRLTTFSFNQTFAQVTLDVAWAAFEKKYISELIAIEDQVHVFKGPSTEKPLEKPIGKPWEMIR